MNSKATATIEFDAEIKHGMIQLPSHIADKIAQAGVTKLSIRLMSKSVSDRLKRVGVTEEEIDRISSLQLESREHVLSFLESQGSLVRGGFGKRFLSL